jgi:hypothetical protein
MPAVASIIHFGRFIASSFPRSILPRPVRGSAGRNLTMLARAIAGQRSGFIYLGKPIAASLTLANDGSASVIRPLKRFSRLEVSGRSFLYQISQPPNELPRFRNSGNVEMSLHSQCVCDAAFSIEIIVDSAVALRSTQSPRWPGSNLAESGLSCRSPSDRNRR